MPIAYPPAPPPICISCGQLGHKTAASKKCATFVERPKAEVKEIEYSEEEVEEDAEVGGAGGGVTGG